MKDRQTNDAANAGRSGGVSLQGEAPTLVDLKPAPISPASNIPDKSISNGGK